MLLLFWLLWLRRRGQLRWTTAGFWAWAAFLLYFVLNPLLSAVYGDYLWYEITLHIAGGEARAAWIGSTICVGISIFFLVYLHTGVKKVTWRLVSPTLYPATVWAFVLLCIGLGMVSLLTFRFGLFDANQDLIWDQGRYVGTVTGYQHSAHTLILVPTVFLILTTSGIPRLSGILILGIYILASFADPWSRFLGVSVLLVISFIDVVKRSKRWPNLILLVAVVLSTTILQLRGHSSFESGSQFWETATQAPERVLSTLASSDAAMLSTFYLESYTKDTLGGFDYGIPLVNYSLTGLLPNRFFPWKYALVDWLRARQERKIGNELLSLLRGGKSTLIGSFYGEGGLIGVILLMALAGFLSRKLDGMLHKGGPPLILATGIVWMSLLWMVWGSADYWALTQLGILAIPSIGIWLLSPKVARKRRRVSTLAGSETHQQIPSGQLSRSFHQPISRK